MGRAEEKEDRLTDTTEGQGSSSGPNREGEKHKLWETNVSDKKGSQCLMTVIVSGFATGLRWGWGSEKIRAEMEGGGKKKGEAEGK